MNFFIGHLGAEKYGIWVLIGSIFQYRMLLSMGLNSAINRHIPLYLAKNDIVGLSKVISTSLAFLITIAVVLLILTLIIYFNIGNWFLINPELIQTAAYLVLIVGISFAIGMPFQLFNAVLSGMQRYDIINLITLSTIVTRTCILVLLLSNGFGLLTTGVIFGLSEIVFLRTAQFYFSKKLLPDIKISLKYTDLKLLKELLAYGTNTILYAMGAVIIYKASDIIIGIFLGSSFISYFSISASVILLLTQFTQVFSSAVKPAVSDLDGRAEHGKIQEISFLAQKYTLLMLIPAACFLVLMGDNFLNVWVGNKINDAEILHMMATITAIMAVAHFFRLSQHSNFIVLAGRGEHKIFGRMVLIMALMFIILAVISVKIFHWGLISIAWSNFIPIVLVSGIILPIYFNHKMKIHFTDTIKNVWLPAISGTVPSIILIIIWNHLFPPNSWIGLGSVVVSAAALTLLFSWFLSFSKLEQKRVLRIFKLA